MYKIQACFWPKWDGEGEPTGPVFWDDEPDGGPFSTEAEARAAIDSLCEAMGTESRDYRIVPAPDAAYRAAVYLAPDGQSETRLTGPEHASLSDAALLQVAAAEIVRHGLGLDLDHVSVVTWRPRT